MVSNSKNPAPTRQPGCRGFLICPLIFSTRCVDLLCTRAFPDAIKSPDIFSRPPQRSIEHLLDFKVPQRISYKQIIATFGRLLSRPSWTQNPPPCPLEITEMAYAKLWYSHLCTVCVSLPTAYQPKVAELRQHRILETDMGLPCEGL